jgi:hypothetical protein
LRKTNVILVYRKDEEQAQIALSEIKKISNVKVTLIKADLTNPS